MNLDIVLPRVLAAPTDARMPALERWLARGDAGTLAAGNLAAILALQYGLPAPVPYAAISLAGEAAGSAAAQGNWLRADPLHVEVGRAAAALNDASTLGIAPGEAAALAAELTRLFADHGLEFIAAAPGRWYVRVPDGELPVTTPLDEALRQGTASALPRGTGRIKWPSVLTEAQMMLASHEVNALREADGKPTINSVWFWGGGGAPAVSARYAIVHSADPLARGLALLSGARVANVPAGFNGIDAVRADQSVLLVLDDAPSEAFDAAWFVPLAEALRRFEVVHLLLPRGRDTLVARIGRGTRWRWMRRSQPLASHA